MATDEPCAPAAVPPEALALARTLYVQLERLDPSYEARLWDDLDGLEQDVYVYAVWNTIALRRDDILKLFACDDAVGRRT